MDQEENDYAVMSSLRVCLVFEGLDFTGGLIDNLLLINLNVAVDHNTRH